MRVRQDLHCQNAEVRVGGHGPPSWAGGAACKTGTRYSSRMPRKDRQPKARLSGDKWFVYIVRCADGTLYTGITKDVARRCQQHEAGTASRYTRSRLPVELLYHE